MVSSATALSAPNDSAAQVIPHVLQVQTTKSLGYFQGLAKLTVVPVAVGNVLCELPEYPVRLEPITSIRKHDDD
jgi:hypothetical protein